MLINSNNNIRVEDGCFELKMANHIIDRTKTYKYLGIIVDEKFSWADHLNAVCKKLSQAAGAIYKVRNLLSRDTLMLLYHSLVGQKLRYGLICWATASNFLLNKLDVLHNKIVRYLTFSKPCSRAWPLYCKLKVLPLAGVYIVTIFEGIDPGTKVGAALARTEAGTQSATFYFYFILFF